MKNTILFLMAFLITLPYCFAQKKGKELTDSLRSALVSQKNNRVRVNILNQISQNAGLRLGNTDTTIHYAKAALNLADRVGYDKGKAKAANNIATAYYHLSDYSKALRYFNRSLSSYKKIDNKQGQAREINNIGLIYNQLSNYPKALENYQKALDINKDLDNKQGMANVLNNIGNVYFGISHYTKALDYYQQALTLYNQSGDKYFTAANLNNFGKIFSHLSDNAKALKYYKKALTVYRRKGNKYYTASTLNDIGNVYSYMENYPMSLNYYRQALSLNRQTGNKNFIANNLMNIGKCYFRASDSTLLQMNINPFERYDTTLRYVHKAIEISKASGDVSQMAEGQELLSRIYQKQGNYDEALAAYKNYSVLRDSVQGNKIKKKIIRKEVQFKYQKKEAQYLFQQRLTDEQLKRSRQQAHLARKEKELQHMAFLKEQSENKEKQKQLELSKKDQELQTSKIKTLNKDKELQQKKLALSHAKIAKKNTQRNLLIIGGVLLLILAFILYRNFSNQRKSNVIISKEKQKSEDLLLNILPGEVASELKEKGNAEAQQFDEVTVLFTDFVNFTKISETLAPQELVQELNECFTAFDNIMGKYDLEKIKTVGDAYLAVCGMPSNDARHAKNTVLAAIEIRDFIKARRAEGKAFDIRIGIHSGSVVAGIVGIRKFAYDIWGDTVNTAARMEQNSEAGMINISESTYQLVRNEFVCEHRGKIKAKNKGEMDMYFVKNIKNA